MERPKLLLADDSLTVQRVVNLTFADEGMDVISVSDGDAAIREIASARPDIVLADVHMPGPGGLEICSLLRGVEETSKIPVILLVGAFEQFDPAEAEQAGADAFVTKPFQSIRQLVEQVNQLLSSRETEQEALPANSGVQASDPAAEVDTSDIDTLYERSFAETVEMPSAIMAGAEFSSDQLDDEMIETSYSYEQANEPPDLANTPIERFGEHEFENTAVTAGGPDRSEDVRSSYYEETLQMDGPPAAVSSPPQASAHTPATEERRRDPFATTTDAFELDDIDLLDLTLSNAKEEYTITTPSDAVAQGSNKQVVTLSPELLDEIVRKVVEKLSEKY